MCLEITNWVLQDTGAAGRLFAQGSAHCEQEHFPISSDHPIDSLPQHLAMKMEPVACNESLHILIRLLLLWLLEERPAFGLGVHAAGAKVGP